MLAYKVNLTLDSDGGASHNSCSLFGEMKQAVLLQRAANRDSDILSAEAALELATLHDAGPLRSHNRGCGQKI